MESNPICLGKTEKLLSSLHEKLQAWAELKYTGILGPSQTNNTALLSYKELSTVLFKKKKKKKFYFEP